RLSLHGLCYLLLDAVILLQQQQRVLAQAGQLYCALRSQWMPAGNNHGHFVLSQGFEPEQSGIPFERDHPKISRSALKRCENLVMLHITNMHVGGWIAPGKALND